MLKLRDVHVGYDEVPVLFGVTFSVEKGQIVAIVGSNGAGKSTIQRTISGIVRPRSGTIEFDGRQIAGLPIHEITAMGIAHVPEGRRIFTRLSVLENLLVSAYSRPDRAERKRNLERIFTMFPRLYERREQLGGTLSGGEQQMLAIGRGLMLSPKVLMLDEPSLGIAPKLVEDIFQSIQEINREGTTVLLVEQNLVEALELCHRAYVLQTGEIRQEGTGQELLASEDVKKAYLGM